MTTALAITYQTPSSLTANARNTRTHSDKQIEQIMRSIEEFGFTNPILVDEENIVIAGHGRLQAASEMQLEAVPTIELQGLSEEQKRAYVIADNQLALNASWDLEKLGEELAILDESSFDVDLLGFNDNELASLILDQTEADDPYEEWQNMPEFNQPDTQAFRHVVVHFNTPEDVEEFFEKIEQEDTGRTKSIWFPKIERNDTESKRYH